MTIISIFPVERYHELQLGQFADGSQLDTDGNPYPAGTPMGGFRKFRLDPATRASHRALRVEGGLKWIPDFSQVGPDEPTAGITPIWQSAKMVADGLVHKWTRHTLGVTGSPGVEVLKHEDIEVDDTGNPKVDSSGNLKPSRQCIARMRKGQEVYAQSCVERANGLHVQGKTTAITDLDRKMAEWLYGSAVSSLGWVEKPEFQETKKCLACRRDILGSALRCQHCSADLPRWCLDNGVDASGDPAVTAAIERLRAREPVSPEAEAAKIRAIESKPLSHRTKAEMKELVAHRLDNPEE